MKVSNGVYKELKVAWSTLTFPLKEGTPVDKDGKVANSNKAIGLIPCKYTETPLMDKVYVLVGGDVELAEVETLFGTSLTTDAKANMSGIRFWKSDFTVDDSADSKPSDATTEKAGIVKQIANIADSTATTVSKAVEDLNALLTAMKTAGVMAADPEPETDPENGEE